MNHLRSNFWIIPLSYVAYVISLNLANAYYIANDKPVMAIGIFGKFWLCLIVFVFWILLEFSWAFYLKQMEEM